MSMNENEKDMIVTKFCYYDIADLCAKLTDLIYSKGGSLYKLVDCVADRKNGQIWVEAYWKAVAKKEKE